MTKAKDPGSKNLSFQQRRESIVEDTLEPKKCLVPSEKWVSAFAGTTDSGRYCGLVAIVGRPNVGKSTLLNQLIGQKLSITSRKPQTTRTRILGIHTQDAYQTVYVDTPGLNQKTPRALNRHMNRAAFTALEEVDVIMFVVDGLFWNDGDAFALEAVKRAQKPTLLAINKIDQIKSKSLFLPHIKTLSEQYSFANVLLISAKNRSGLDKLTAAIRQLLPEGQHLYGEDEMTDVSERFIVAEFIREKIVRMLGEELPYATAVTIDHFESTPKILRLYATIWVERDGQKAIVLGKNGEKIKEIGTLARQEIEKFFVCKVFLKLWVKVKSGWGDDKRLLQSWGV